MVSLPTESFSDGSLREIRTSVEGFDDALGSRMRIVSLETMEVATASIMKWKRIVPPPGLGKRAVRHTADTAGCA